MQKGSEMHASSQPMLTVSGLRKHFPIGSSFPPWRPSAYVRAVDDINFTVKTGETLGVVGESGCGKSTMARLLIRLIEPDDGEIILDGLKIGASDGISVR